MKYFKNIKDLEQAKEKYKKLALKFHPDKKNGNEEIMQEINREYGDLVTALRLLPQLQKISPQKRIAIPKEYKDNIINSAADIAQNVVKTGFDLFFERFFTEK